MNLTDIRCPWCNRAVKHYDDDWLEDGLNERVCDHCEQRYQFYAEATWEVTSVHKIAPTMPCLCVCGVDLAPTVRREAGSIEHICPGCKRTVIARFQCAEPKEPTE